MLANRRYGRTIAREGKGAAPHGGPLRARKALAAALATAVIAVGAAVSIGLYARERPLSVAAAALDEREIAAYGKALSKAKGLSKLSARPTLKDSLSGRASEVLVARLGAELSGSSAAFTEIPAETLAKLPPSVRAASLDAAGRPFVMPVELDPFQVAYSYAGFGPDAPRNDARLTDKDIDSALKRHKDPRAPAMLFAGGDDETLLLVISVLCEVRGGAAAYQALVAAAAKGGDLSAIASIPVGTAPDGSAFGLGSLMEVIKGWKAKGYLHPEWFSLQPADVVAYLKGGLGLVALLPLSLRREVPYEAISGYGWDSYPGSPAGRARAYVAPLTGCAVAARGGARSARAARAAMGALTDSRTALEMAKETGRATTLAAAPAPDIQAADALAWAAGASIVVNGLYRDAFVTEADAKSFAAAVRAELR